MLVSLSSSVSLRTVRYLLLRRFIKAVYSSSLTEKPSMRIVIRRFLVSLVAVLFPAPIGHLIRFDGEGVSNFSDLFSSKSYCGGERFSVKEVNVRYEQLSIMRMILIGEGRFRDALSVAETQWSLLADHIEYFPFEVIGIGIATGHSDEVWGLLRFLSRQPEETVTEGSRWQALCGFLSEYGPRKPNAEHEFRLMGLLRGGGPHLGFEEIERRFSSPEELVLAEIASSDPQSWGVDWFGGDAKNLFISSLIYLNGEKARSLSRVNTFVPQSGQTLVYKSSPPANGFAAISRPAYNLGRFFVQGSPNMAQIATADLLANRTRHVFCVGVSLYSGLNTYRKTYTSPRTSESLQKSTDTLISMFVDHDPLENWSFMKLLRECGRVSGDGVFEKVLDGGLEHYLAELEATFVRERSSSY